MAKRKQWTKYWWFILILIVSGYYFLTNRNDGTISPRETAFAIADTTRIATIILSNDTTTIVLTKQNEGWTVNGTYPVRQDAIDALIRVLQSIQIAAPLPLTLSDSLSAIIAEKGKRVQILSPRRTVRDYNLYSSLSLDLENLGILAGAKSGYQLQLPNYRGDIGSLINLSLSYWQANQLGIANRDGIARVDVEIPVSPELSFSIELDGVNPPSILSLYYNQRVQSYDTARLQRFLVELTNLTYDFQISGLAPEDRAAITLSEPDYIFTFHGSDGYKEQMTIYPIPMEEYLDHLGRTVSIDLDNIYVTQPNDSGIFQAKYLTFHPVLRDISYFKPKKSK